MKSFFIAFVLSIGFVPSVFARELPLDRLSLGYVVPERLVTEKLVWSRTAPPAVELRIYSSFCRHGRRQCPYDPHFYPVHGLHLRQVNGDTHVFWGQSVDCGIAQDADDEDERRGDVILSNSCAIKVNVRDEVHPYFGVEHSLIDVSFVVP